MILCHPRRDNNVPSEAEAEAREAHGAGTREGTLKTPWRLRDPGRGPAEAATHSTITSKTEVHRCREVGAGEEAATTNQIRETTNNTETNTRNIKKTTILTRTGEAEEVTPTKETTSVNNNPTESMMNSQRGEGGSRYPGEGKDHRCGNDKLVKSYNILPGEVC